MQIISPSGRPFDAAAGRALHAASLERAVLRLRELRGTVAALTRLAELRCAEDELTRLVTARDAANVRRDGIAAAASGERKKADAHRERHGVLAKEVLRATMDRDLLEGAIEQSERAEGLRQKLAELVQTLAGYPVDLDEQALRAGEAAEGAQTAGLALPHFTNLARHRCLYRKAGAEELEAASVHDAACSDVTRLETEERSAEAKLTAATTRKAVAERALVASDTRLSDARDHLAKFIAQAGAEVCSACGQTITADHAEQERGRMERAITDAEGEVNRLRAAARR